MLTTPLTVLAFAGRSEAPSFAIGILLPLLCVGDGFSLFHYWGKWERRNLIYLLPGVAAGVVVGVQLIGRFSARELNLAIGLLAVGFVVFQLVKEWIFRAEGAFAPNHLVGIPCGIAAGITSTFAHGAGPLVSIFVIPQKLSKEVYVGTTVLVFSWINWIKLPFFFSGGIITEETLRVSLAFAPLIPLGVWAGVWLNRRVSETVFSRMVYAFTLLAGLELIFQFDLRRFL